MMIKSIRMDVKALILVAGMLTANFSFGQVTEMPQKQNQGSIEVNDAELEKFAKVFQRLQLANQEIQQEMIKVIEAEGMDVAAFNTIHQAKMQGQKTDTSTEDLAKYEAVVAKIDGLQGDFKARMENLITENGFTIERYQEIATALQDHPELQERLKAILVG